MTTHMYQAMLVNKCLITHITGIWTITSIYSLMSSKTTQLTVYPILHIAGIFSDAFSFHAWLCVSAMTLLNVVFGLSLTLGYPLRRSSKPASCKYFNGTANRMYGDCCQLVFVIDVSLGYVQYFGDFNYFFQFTACFLYIYIYLYTNLIQNKLLSTYQWYIWISPISKVRNARCML